MGPELVLCESGLQSGYDSGLSPTANSASASGERWLWSSQHVYEALNAEDTC